MRSGKGVNESMGPDEKKPAGEAETALSEEKKAEKSRDAWTRSLHDSKVWHNVKTTVCVTVSALLQAFMIQTFIRPAELLSSGFTGVALLLELLAQKAGFSFPAQIGVLCINIPVGLFCARGISKRFSFFSFLNVFLLSFFLQVCNFQPVFRGEPLLDVIFGGFIGGIGTVIALRGNASTGGTDFIAMYGWMNAAYSVLYSFVSTKTVSTFHHRYDRVTLQITTKKAKEIIEVYTSHFPHGISCASVMGGYSHQQMYLLHTVLSSYEEQEAIRLIRKTDPGVIINVMKTSEFYGKYVTPTIE